MLDILVICGYAHSKPYQFPQKKNIESNVIRVKNIYFMKH